MGYGSDYVDELHDDLQAARATIARLTAELAKAREDALEEAAKVADTLAGLYRKEEREPSRSIGASQAAAAIRALKGKQP